jgi:hypothetical protein
MKYIVNDTPISKNNIIYGVGDTSPYTDKDKKLLWNLTEVKEDYPKSKTKKTNSKIVSENK